MVRGKHRAGVKQVPSFIAGRFEESAASEFEEIPDPANGRTIAVLAHSTAEEIGRAVAAARKAYPEWSETPVPQRAQVMFRLKHLLEAHFEELSLLVVRENGKTLDEARGEVRRGIEVADFACGAPSLLMGGKLEQIAAGIDQELVRYPVGVAVGITPFNFPNMIPLWVGPGALV